MAQLTADLLIKHLSGDENLTLHFPQELEQMARRYEKQIGGVQKSFPETCARLAQAGIDESTWIAAFLTSKALAQAGEIPNKLHKYCYEEAFFRFVQTLALPAAAESAELECKAALSAILATNSHPCFQVGEDLCQRAGDGWISVHAIPGDLTRLQAWIVKSDRLIHVRLSAGPDVHERICAKYFPNSRTA